MRLGALILALALGIVFAPCAADAQQIGKVHRVGFLWDGPQGVTGNAEDGLRRGLRDLGYVEGQTIVIEYRYADNRSERLPTLVAELVQLPVDVILALGGSATRAAKQGTSSIPIVATSGLLDHLVASLARPGGNLTGISLQTSPAELQGKWIEILKEVSPKAADAGVLYQEGRIQVPAFWEEYARVAATLGLHLHRFPVRRPEDLDAAFTAMR